MTVENIGDHRALTCECGSVRFCLLKSGGIECYMCSKRRDGSWGEAPIADSLASAGGVEVEIDRLRDALEHIQKACVLSRTQSRRIRWIETRAHGALIGDDRLHRSIDLPKDGGPDTAEKLRRRMLQDRHTFRVAQGLAAGILSAALSKEREVADGLRAELEAAYEALARIGDFAHDKSTGPAVPDALWEIRSMAYDAVRPAIDALTAHRESRGANELLRRLGSLYQLAQPVKAQRVDLVPMLLLQPD